MEEIWAEKMKIAFDELMEEMFGTKAAKPGCFGAGNGMPWCKNCSYQNTC